MSSNPGRFGEKQPCRRHRSRNCLSRACTAQWRAAAREANQVTDDSYPTCSTCGHYGSGILGGQCTAIVPYPIGSGAHAGYCNCPCLRDDVVAAWYEEVHGTSPSGDRTEPSVS